MENMEAKSLPNGRALATTNTKTYFGGCVEPLNPSKHAHAFSIFRRRRLFMNPFALVYVGEPSPALVSPKGDRKGEPNCGGLPRTIYSRSLMSHIMSLLIAGKSNIFYLKLALFFIPQASGNKAPKIKYLR